MQLSRMFRTGIWIAALCLYVQGQNTPSQNAPSTDAQISETKGLPPRVAPTHYQAQGQAGTGTVASDLVGHSVPTAQGTFSADGYRVDDTAMRGPPALPP